MIKETIGENAGRIWHILDDNGEMELSELLKISKIDDNDFNMAIGWLAREDKISFYDKGKKQMAYLVS